MATHSSVLAWRIPGTEEPSGLPSMGSHRVGHNGSDAAAAAAAAELLWLPVAREAVIREGRAWLQEALGACGGHPQYARLSFAAQVSFTGWWMAGHWGASSFP